MTFQAKQAHTVCSDWSANSTRAQLAASPVGSTRKSADDFWKVVGRFSNSKIIFYAVVDKFVFLALCCVQKKNKFSASHPLINWLTVFKNNFKIMLVVCSALFFDGLTTLSSRKFVLKLCYVGEFVLYILCCLKKRSRQRWLLTTWLLIWLLIPFEF